MNSQLPAEAIFLYCIAAATLIYLPALWVMLVCAWGLTLPAPCLINCRLCPTSYLGTNSFEAFMIFAAALMAYDLIQLLQLGDRRSDHRPFYSVFYGEYSPARSMFGIGTISSGT